MKRKPIILQKLLPLVLFLVLAVSCLTACQKEDSLSFEAFTEELFIEEISANTLNLHYSLKDPAALGITEYEISLGDFSKEARLSTSSYLKETLSTLLSYDYESLSLENQLTYDILVDYFDTQLALNKYDLFQEPLQFSSGLQMELPILFAEYTFYSEQDVKDYLKMIALTNEFFDQVMDFEAEKSDNQLFMSPSSCQLVIESCKSFLSNKEKHYLITSFASRLESLGLSKQKKASYLRQNQAILEKQLFPAYENMITKLESLKSRGQNDLGVCYLENGKEYYETLVYAETGCSDPMDVLFRRIENKRLEDLLICSSLQECSSPQWKMTDFSTMLSQLETKMQEDFPTALSCNYSIRHIDSALEEYLAPAFYITAPIDNYTENVIYINDSYISSDIYSFTTLAHEGYPGHLYQTVMTYHYDLPLVRSLLNYSGYTEGWATYVESLSYQYAGLDADVSSFLSANESAILSLYASSDIGLHYYGWDMETLTAFWAGYGITNETAIKEIAQLILSEPGNYLKYYIGYIEFLELKDYAKDLFGSEYSDIQFHKAILDIGPAPFSILEKYLPKYYSPQT